MAYLNSNSDYIIIVILARKYFTFTFNQLKRKLHSLVPSDLSSFGVLIG